jgi:transposase
MSKVTTFVGIDPSSTKNCCMVDDGVKVKKYQIDNTVEAQTAFFESLAPRSVIGIEASGSYSERALHCAVKCGHIVKRISNRKVMAYTVAKGHKNKTDPEDARAILQFLKENHTELPDFVPDSPEKKALKQKTQLLQSYKVEWQRFKNRLHSLHFQMDIPQDLISHYEQHICDLEVKIKALEVEITEQTKQTMQEEVKLLTSIKGIGKATAEKMLIWAGDLLHNDPSKNIASYLGVSPSIYQSGKKSHSRGIGRTTLPDLRATLYVCSWSAVRYNLPCKAIYERMIAKGKCKKVALIAVVHKLVKQMYGVLKNNKDFINEILPNLTSLVPNEKKFG